MREFGILMLLFATLLCAYGFTLYRTGDCALIPHSEKAVIRDKKDYARRVGKIVMWISLAPAIAAGAAFLSELGVPVRPIGFVLACNAALFLWVGIRVFMKDEEK